MNHSFRASDFSVQWRCYIYLPWAEDPTESIKEGGLCSRRRLLLELL